MSEIDVIEALIRVFAEYSQADLDQQESAPLLLEFDVDEIDEILQITYYHKWIPHFNSCDKKITQVSKLAVSDQPRRCLMRLNSIKNKGSNIALDDQNARIFYQLVNKRLATHWPAESQELFKTKSSIILDWKDFFFSYTNKDAGATNSSFKGLIEHQYVELPPDLQHINFVARIMVKLLGQYNVQGFADYQHIRPGEVIEEEVFNYCESSFAFIQLIEDQVFVIPSGAGDRNWCLEEFERFRDFQPDVLENLSTKRNFQFLVTDDAVAYPDNPELYKVWSDAIKGKLHTVLSELDYKALRVCMKSLAEEIRNVRRSIIKELVA